jgi:hypothetical protein
MNFTINLLPLLSAIIGRSAGINEIIDGFYINPDGTKGKHVLDE